MKLQTTDDLVESYFGAIGWIKRDRHDVATRAGKRGDKKLRGYLLSRLRGHDRMARYEMNQYMDQLRLRDIMIEERDREIERLQGLLRDRTSSGGEMWS